MATFRVHFKLFGQGRFVDIEQTPGWSLLDQVSNGIWLTADYQLTGGAINAVYWIPPSQIQLLERVKAEIES